MRKNYSYEKKQNRKERLKKIIFFTSIYRYYRQHCTPDFGSYTKDLSAICSDLNRIFIIDNSPGAYRRFPNNAIPIKTWISDPMDISLLSLLPLLDALRFTHDVRSVLSRNLHLHRVY